MKKILIVVSVYRQGERIHPIIPRLSSQYELSLLCVHQMSDRIGWNGKIDMREYFHNTYDKYFSSIYSNWKSIDYSKYDGIIFDDCRDKGEEIPYKLIYREAKKHKAIVFGNQHGNRDFNPSQWEISHVNQVFDYCFVFGNHAKKLIKPFAKKDVYLPAGIPSNDALGLYPKTSEYILVITNFLANERRVFPNIFGDEFVKKINLKGLQEKYQKPVVVKIKNRDRHFAIGNPYQKDIEFVQSVLSNNGINGTVIRDCDDDNLLISNAHSVIGISSTLCYKPIQLGIPTAILDGGNFIGCFNIFAGFCDAGSVEQVIDLQLKFGRDNEYIKNVLEGGYEYNSTDIYIKHITDILNEV
tara:strand:+ start:2323 stop:3390 length:1068 start_codon:yes stop_codon:yes gene_type:complete